MHRARLEEQDRGELVYLIGWSGEVPVGHATATWPDPRRPSEFRDRLGCVEVGDVFVEPGHRRKGIGRALMEAVESVTREQAIDTIGLATGLDEGYASARRLYHSLGYRELPGSLHIASARAIGNGGRGQWLDVLTYWVKHLRY